MVSFIFRTLIASTFLLGTAALALAQGQGTLTGRILDPEGLALPGVTVTAESETMLGTRSAVSDGVGNYRLPALTPGMYTVTAQLSGFAPLRRENIQVRTGSNFRVDLQMALGNVEETITVTAESPMIEMKKPGQVITIDGDFQRDVPVQARKNWTDFVELTPGVNARNWDDGSGRMTFFGHGTEHFHHVMQLEGTDRERLRRLSVALYPVDHRSDRRRRDQDGGRLRRRPDGERSHHQHHHAERW